MTPPRPIQLVVFDLGGVIVRICQSFEQAAARAGLAFEPARILDPERKAERKRLHGLYERGRLGCDEFFAGVSATTGGLYTPEEFRRVHESWIIEEYPGVHALIDDLHAAGLHTGALSNTNAAHWAQMSRPTPDRPAAFDAPARLRHRHASHLLGHAKPDAPIYGAFIEHTGFHPGSVVFFDDLEANVAAAIGCGWHAHRIDPSGDPAAQIRGHLLGLHGVDPGASPAASRRV